MDRSRPLELPMEMTYEEYAHRAHDEEALFGPLARKTMLAIALVLLVLIGLTVIVTNPLTLIPFALVVFAIHYYRKISRSHYRKMNRIHRK